MNGYPRGGAGAKERRIGRAIDFHQRWNEWAEGCHLEPDEKYGLRLAKCDCACAATSRVQTGATIRPAAFILQPPRIESIKVPALTGRREIGDLGVVLSPRRSDSFVLTIASAANPHGGIARRYSLLV